MFEFSEKFCTICRRIVRRSFLRGSTQIKTRKYAEVTRFVVFGLLISVVLGGGVIFLKDLNVLALAPEESQPPAYQTRTLKYFVLQNGPVLTTGNQVDQAFSVYIAEQNPVIQSAMIEIRGNLSNVGVAPSMTVSIDDIPLSSPRAITYNLDANGNKKHFRVYYDVSSYLSSQITGPGTWNFTLSVKANDTDISALSAILELTYQFTPGGGGYPVYSDMLSAIFDTTGSSDGPAYNSILWKGALGGLSNDQGVVKFQFAASDSSSGPWTFIGGTTCSSGDWYMGASDTPIEIGCFSDFNNKRYFRYKIRICSKDCSATGDYTPEVYDVVVSWSP